MQSMSLWTSDGLVSGISKRCGPSSSKTNWRLARSRPATSVLRSVVSQRAGRERHDKSDRNQVQEFGRGAPSAFPMLLLGVECCRWRSKLVQGKARACTGAEPVPFNKKAGKCQGSTPAWQADSIGQSRAAEHGTENQNSGSGRSPSPRRLRPQQAIPRQSLGCLVLGLDESSAAGAIAPIPEPEPRPEPWAEPRAEPPAATEPRAEAPLESRKGKEK